MTSEQNGWKGLTSAEAEIRLKLFGKNEPVSQKKEHFLFKLLNILSEPMFLLLIAAAIIYFILGSPRDGAVMLVFVVGMIGIDVFQEWKTDRTLKTLKDLSAPHVKVIRDGRETEIESTELVPGDLMIIYEGVKIPADGAVLRCSDLCIDESSLTGEAEGVWKVNTGNAQASGDYWRKDYCYAGTLVIQGTALILIEKTGTATEYGKIGADIAAAPDEASPLQKQTRHLVKLCAVIAGIMFLLAGVLTYINLPDHTTAARSIESILSGITLAMAMIPEEFPVILTVFLSMGAWRLAKKKSLVRKLPAVEALGEISVLCADKTGTITTNQMKVQALWAPAGNQAQLCEVMGLACEIKAFDPMEKAMLLYCESLGITQEHLFGGELIAEYAFTDDLKMMGHAWHHDGEIVIAAKGSPEHILTICELSAEERQNAELKITEMSLQGLRVIAVACMKPGHEKDIPPHITECSLILCGLIGLADPPRETVKNDIAVFCKAGIRVVMITGDYGITASSIARKINMQNSSFIITGDMLDFMTDEELGERVESTGIFSRVKPEHKMRIVKAFKANGEIVAMTGDGVNDAPALKYADIGIAMGKRGSEVSREAADLILMDDNFSTIVESITDGRRIYDNIRKAVGYVLTIHIPIAFSSLLAPVLGINPENLFLLPIHVVLLELIIDPTCSIVFERQPAERNIMSRSPRNPQEKMLTPYILIKSTLQGLVIFAAAFFTYLIVLSGKTGHASLARTMGFAIIILSNLLLVHVNSSEQESILQSFKKLLMDRIMRIADLATITGLILILYTPLNSFLKLTPLTVSQLLNVVVVATAAVLWYEPVKAFKKRIRRNKNN